MRALVGKSARSTRILIAGPARVLDGTFPVNERPVIPPRGSLDRPSVSTHDHTLFNILLLIGFMAINERHGALFISSPLPALCRRLAVRRMRADFEQSPALRGVWNSYG